MLRPRPCAAGYPPATARHRRQQIQQWRACCGGPRSVSHKSASAPFLRGRDPLTEVWHSYQTTLMWKPSMTFLMQHTGHKEILAGQHASTTSNTYHTWEAAREVCLAPMSTAALEGGASPAPVGTGASEKQRTMGALGASRRCRTAVGDCMVHRLAAGSRSCARPAHSSWAVI